MTSSETPEGEESDRTKSRRHALAQSRRWEETPQAALAGETEASLRSAFALADLLGGLQGR
jgi:hypothetical protein